MIYHWGDVASPFQIGERVRFRERTARAGESGVVQAVNEWRLLGRRRMRYVVQFDHGAIETISGERLESLGVGL